MTPSKVLDVPVNSTVPFDGSLSRLCHELGRTSSPSKRTPVNVVLCQYSWVRGSERHKEILRD